MPTAGKPKIKSYGLDFKLRVVQLSHQPNVLVKDLADSVGIHPFMFSKWRKRVSRGRAAPFSVRQLRPTSGLNA